MDDKIDPYHTKEKYFMWKAKALKNGISGLTNFDSQIILQYLQDMEQGLNVASTNKKGGRSPIRLNSISLRLIFFARHFHNRFSVKLIEVEESQLFSFFADMRNGTIRKSNGSTYKSVGDYVKEIKAFWHWWQKVNRRKGIEIKDITQDLDKSYDKPGWVYLTEDQVKQLSNNAEYKYNVLIWFLFDSGIRAPTELVNVRVTDFHNDFKEIHIREETSKTFGRRIKLMISTDTLKEYIKTKERITQLLKSCLSVART